MFMPHLCYKNVICDDVKEPQIEQKENKTKRNRKR